MKTSSKVLLTLLAAFVVSFVITWVFYGIDQLFFYGVLFYVVSYAGVYVYLYASKYFADRKSQTEYEQKRSFNACWNLMNIKLATMPGGRGLKWDEGFSRVSSIRTFEQGVERRTYRSMRGLLQSGSVVIVIWDIDNEDIAAFNSNPQSRDLDDPFNEKFFKPFDRPKIMPMGGRFDRRGRRIGITYPGSNMQFGSSLEVPDSAADTAYNNMMQNQ